MALLDRVRRGFLRSRKKVEQDIESDVLKELEHDSEEAFVNHQNFVVKKMKAKELTMEEASRELVATTRQLDRRKIEYEQITAYLTDIQLIDQMTDEEREAEHNSDGWIPFRFSPCLVGEEVVCENYIQMVKSVLEEKNKVNELKKIVL
jgi:hypothetical protein